MPESFERLIEDEYYVLVILFDRPLTTSAEMASELASYSGGAVRLSEHEICALVGRLCEWGLIAEVIPRDYSYKESTFEMPYILTHQGRRAVLANVSCISYRVRLSSTSERRPEIVTRPVIAPVNESMLQ